MKTCLTLASLVLLAAVSATRAQITVNLNSVNAGTGVDATPLLASYGISIVNNNYPGSVLIISDNDYYGTGVVTANPPPNFLIQNVGGSPNGITYTMDFLTPLTSFGFTRIAINAPSVVAQWTATAYVGNSAVDSVGENFFGGVEGAQAYDLTGAGITSVTWVANGSGSAGIPSAPISDIVLTPVPEPATTALLGLIGLAALARARRLAR